MEEQIRSYQKILKNNPLDVPAFTALEELYLGEDRWEDLVQLYQQRIAHSADSGQQLGLLVKCAGVVHHRLGNVGLAQDLYRRILALDVHNRTALDGLAELYRKQGDWRQLALILEQMALMSADAVERADLFSQLGNIYSERLNRQDRALVAWQHALAADGKRVEIINALHRLYMQRGAFARAWQLLEHEQQCGVTGPEQMGEKFLEFGRSLLAEPLHEDTCRQALERAAQLLPDAGPTRQVLAQLEENLADREKHIKRLRVEAVESPDKARAVSLYRQIAEIYFLMGDHQKEVEENLGKCNLLSPGNQRVLEFMEHYYLQKRQPKELLDRLEEMAGRAADPRVAVPLLERIAMHSLVHLQDRKAATATYLRILEIEPGHQAALASLVESYQEEGRWAEVVELMRSQAERLQEPLEKANLLLEVARITSEHLRDPQAAHFVYEEVLRLDGENQPAAAALVGWYEKHQEWSSLVNCLEILLRGATEKKERLKLLERLAAVHADKRQDAVEAFRARVRALAIDPGKKKLLKEVVDLGNQTGHYQELVGALAAAADSGGVKGKALLEILSSMADIYEQRLNMPGEAIHVWQRVLELEPKSMPALDALERLQSSGGGSVELVDVYQRQLELVRSGEKKKELLFKLAEIYSERMADYERAVNTLQQVVEIDADDVHAWSRLADLEEREGHWEQAAAALEKSLARVRDAAQANVIRRRLAEIFEQRLNDTERALALCADILGDESVENDVAAAAVAILERLQGRGVSPLKIAQILQPYYALAGDWRRHVDMLELRLETCDSDEERLNLLDQIGRVYQEKLDQPELAYNAWSRAFRLSPADEEIFDKVSRLAEETGRLEDLAALLEEVQAGTEQPSLVVELHGRLGALYAQRLNRPQQAIRSYRAMLEARPGDVEVLQMLEALYRQTGAWEDLARAGEALIAGCSDAEEKKSRMLDLAETLEQKVHDRPAAIEWLRKVREEFGDDREILQRLDTLLEAAGQWPDLAEVLQREIELADAEEAAELKLRLGRVQAERMEEGQHAVEYYRQVLEEKPDDSRAIAGLESLLGQPDAAAAAAEILRPVLESRKEWQKLVGVLEVLADKAEQAQERLPYLVQVANLFETRLEQPEKSFSALRRALVIDPGKTEVLQALRRLAEKLAAYGELAAALEDAVGSSEDPSLRVPLLQELAGLYRDKLRRPELAATSLRRLLEVEPDNGTALASLETLYRESKSLQELAWVLERQAELTGDADQQRDRLVQVAQIREEQLGDLEGAMQIYQRIFERHPDDLQAAKQLDRLYRETGRWAEDAELLPRLAKLSKNTLSVIDYLTRLAEITSERLDDPRGAVQILRQVLEAKPNHSDSVERLEQLLRDERSRLAAAEVLEGVYRATSEWRKLAAVLEMQLAASADGAQRLRLFGQLRELYEERMGEQALAFNVAARAFKEQPQDDGVFQDLVRLAEQARLHEELVGTLMDVSDHHVGSELGVVLSKRVAHLQEKLLGQRQEAIARWQQLWETQGADEEILAALERLYREEGNFAELVKVYQAQFELAGDDEQKKDLLFRTAACLAEGLEDNGGAIAAYEQILQIDATDRRALHLLAGLLESAGRWAELLRVLDAQMAVLTGGEVGQPERDQIESILLHKAEICLNQLDDVQQGMQAAAQALEMKPADARVMELLEQCLPREDQRQAAAQLLEPVYRRQGDFKKLVAILEVQLAAQSTDEQRQRLYRELMRLYEEELGQKPLAFTVACRAFRQYYADSGIRADLERLAEQTGSQEELAAVYEEMVEQARDSEAGPEIERRLAQLKEAYLEDKDEAVSHWRHVLASNPDDPEALRALERLYRERGLHGELVGILRHMATLESDNDRKKDLFHEVASLMEERLGRDDGAIDAYREILAIDAGDLAVLKLLDRLLQRQGRWEELVEVLQTEMSLAAESELPGLRLRLARLHRQQLGNPETAVQLYQQVLEQEADNQQAVADLLEMFESVELRHLVVDALVGPLQRNQDWKSLVAVLDAKARLAQQADEKKSAWLAMAELYERQLGQKELAMTILGRAFAVDPQDEQVRLSLERLAAETDSFEMLSAVYEQGLEMVEDKTIRQVLHRRLAGLYLQRLQEPEQALEHLEAVVELTENDEEAMLALENAYRQRGEPEKLVKVLRKRARASSDEEARVAILYEIATIHQEQLDDLGGAIQAFRQVLEVRPGDLNALRMLDRLCVEQGRIKDLAEVLQLEIQVLQQAGQTAEALDTMLRLARLVEQEFKDSERAGQLLAQILEIDPGHQPTVEYLEEALVEGRSLEGLAGLLERAYQGSGNWQKYIDILESQVRQSRVMARRLELLKKIAEIQEHQLGLKTLAFNTTVRMFHEDLANSEIRAELERLAVEDENLEALAAVYEEELDNIEEPTVGVAIALKVAEIQRGEMEDDDEAIRFYRAALRFDARNLEALNALDELYGRRDDTENLVEVLSRKVDLLEEPAERARILFRLGRLMYEKLEAGGKAVGYFRKVLELEPGHVDSLRLLERIFAELGEHESMYEVLRARLEYTTDAGEKVELVARLADLAADQLGRPQEAIELWEGVAEDEQFAEDAYEALDLLYEQTERWADLAALTEKRMQATADPEKVAVLSGRLGWVKGEKLGELEDAKRHYQEVLRLDPKDANALQSLRGIYSSAGEWEQLLGVLRRLVQLQEDMIGVKQIRFELAEVLGSKLERHQEAIEAAKRAADIEPHTAEDLERLARIFQANEAWQDAVQVLEQAVEKKESDSDKIDALLEVASIWRDKIERPLGAAPVYEKILQIDPFHENAFRAAEKIYRDNKEWRRLTALLEGRLNNIRERRDRMELIKEIATIYEERLGQKELAFARYCAAFREDFSDDQVLAKLESLAEETEDYETLLEVLEDAIEELGSGARVVRLYRKIADIYRTHQQDNERAEQFLRQATELDPRETAALDALADLLEEQERWEDLIAVLEKKYERSDELEQRKEVRRRIAVLQEERLDRVDLAVESYRRILELDGRDGLAIQSLIRLLQTQQRWQELIQVLHRAAEQAEDRQITTNHLFNIASIWETELDSDEEAIAAYQAVLEVDEGHLESLKALERIYTRLDRWSELLGVFERQVELVEQTEEKIRLYNKMGSIWEERFANLENAQGCHESILALDPNCLPSVKALERLTRRMGEFEKLIELYHRHLELIEDRGEKVEIYLAIGDVWYREMSRVDRAEEVFSKALEVDGQSRPAIHALGQLYEKSGNWFNAIEMLQKEAELCGASPEAVDLYYRMGKINEDMLLDSGAAREAYTRALAIDPSYLPAIKALKLIHYLDKDFDKYLEMMVQEAEHTEDVEERTRLFYEIGKFLQEHYEDTSQAAGYYEQSLQLTADFLPAAKPLADIYFRTEQWEKAESMMEVVVQGLDRNSEARELCRQYYRLGYITEKLGKGERALEHYRQSYELDATYLPALEGLGNALIKAEQWEEAYRIYQTILIHHRDSLSDAEVAELYWQIGDINFQMKENERAIASFKKALEIDDTHLASLQYIVSIYQEQELWEEAYDYSLKMVDALEDDDLLEHYLRLGDMCREKLDDPFRAVDAYQGALRLQEDNLEVLTRLLDVFVETSQSQKAVDILERITQVEARPRLLVEYHQQAGRLLRDELHNPAAAVEHFNAALDIDPSQVACFREIVEILRARKDWPGLKENYIRMIKRLPIDARRVKLALWKDLGELCRVVLRNLNESIDAYRMITSLDPNDVESLAILGDLLAARPATLEEAIATHHRVLRMSADRVASYRVLWKLYNQRKEYDKVYVLASILRYLKKADEEERKIYNYFSRKAPQVASRPVNERVWETALAHPEVKVPFTRIFALLYRKAPAMFIKDHKEVNLKKQGHLDLARDRSLFAHNFRVAAKVLGGMDVQLFPRKDEAAPQPPGLVIVPTRPTAMIAYKEMFREDRKKHLLFQIGRQLAASRSQFILAYSLAVKDLEILLQAACWLVEPEFSPTLEHRLVEPVRSRLRRAMPEAGRGMLKRAVEEYLAEPRKYNLRRWVEAVEHSINRAGFIVCNDLATTLGVLRKEPAWLTPMRSIQKVREMLVFAASPEYLELRKMLGLAVTG